MLLLLKLLSGIANSVDPDQTAPSALFAYVSLLEALVYEFLTFTLLISLQHDTY